ncbi:hypothetical protein ACQP25_16830 [Microtetraspora malaysiensis]|uniref:hypothetical protein n=1 Tax=Microtetraspora malaysiensis TaxID=161358 RepID=UPI003D8BD4BC
MSAPTLDISTCGIAEITDDIAQTVCHVIAEHFGAHPDCPPRVMDTDWDGGADRVIAWPEGLEDWAYLVRHGGMSYYGCPIDFAPMPLPVGVWVEPVNEQAIRVLPLP